MMGQTVSTSFEEVKCRFLLCSVGSADKSLGLSMSQRVRMIAGIDPCNTRNTSQILDVLQLINKRLSSHNHNAKAQSDCMGYFYFRQADIEYWPDHCNALKGTLCLFFLSSKSGFRLTPYSLAESTQKSIRYIFELPKNGLASHRCPTEEIWQQYYNWNERIVRNLK